MAEGMSAELLALKSGVAGNLATNVIEHQLKRLPPGRARDALGWLGVVEPGVAQPNAHARLSRLMGEALGTLFARHPEYDVRAVASFFGDEAVAAQIGEWLLRGEPLDTDAL